MSKEFIRSLRQATGAGDPYSGRGAHSRMQGTHQGQVVDNKDPEGRYRVKVSFKGVDGGKLTSTWIQVGSSMAGNDYGFMSLPEVDDTVLVNFLDGDPERGVITGSVWNGPDLPPQSVTFTPDDIEASLPNGDQGGENNFRMFRSRNMSHLLFGDKDGEGIISLRTVGKAELVLNDKGGAEKVQLYDHNRNQWLEIDVVEKKITLQTDTGEILIKAKTKITLDCEDLIMKASKSIKVDSGTTSDWKAKGALTWKTDATAKYESSGNTTVKGAKIDLNP